MKSLVKLNFTLTRQGRDKPWYGHSGWGHPDYIRKSVSMPDKTRGSLALTI